MATFCGKVIIMYLSVLCVSLLLQISGWHSNGNINFSSLEKIKHSPLFLFGDSLFDSGNNNYINTTFLLQSNYEPYGETFFRFPTGRFSDGRLISDFVAEYAKLPLLSPFLYPGKYEEDYVYGMNFASAGAGALMETNQGLVTDLKRQARYFREVWGQLRKNVGDTKAKALISRAVFLFSVGGNDYSTPFLLTNSSIVNLPYPPQQFVDVVIGNITTIIQEIYKKGGRKFGFVNVAALNCFPILRRNGSSMSECQKEEASALATLHNNAISKTFQNLSKQLKGFTYSLFDFNFALLQLMKFPSKYGFKEGNIACCGGGPYRGDNSCGGKRGIQTHELCENVNEYVFFDSIHPTEAAAQFFANLMWFGNSDFVQPFNLKQLFQFGIGI